MMNFDELDKAGMMINLDLGWCLTENDLDAPGPGVVMNFHGLDPGLLINLCRLGQKFEIK